MVVEGFSSLLIVAASLIFVVNSSALERHDDIVEVTSTPWSTKKLSRLAIFDHGFDDSTDEEVH